MTNIGNVALVWVDNQGSDWLGVYLDGAKIYEGHPPTVDDALDALKVDYVEHVFPSAQLSDLRRMRGLPATLAAVAEEVAV